ncbi:MAG TPA: ATP-binding cassette domain-containing protein, partial [Telluria sp.]|nr:ATP-binding cassette domain-containing protein [Telluria sp.]
MRGVRKTFPGVVALDRVNLRVRAGDIHAVVGENGAGKSTLMKVLSGVYPHGSYTGDIEFDGAVRAFRDIADSEALGIVIIHQELALVPQMSIAENIFLGNEPARAGVIDRAAMATRTRALLAQVGLDASPDTLVGELGVGKQQLVEIAKALSKQVRLLILDEPTASLNDEDSDKLLTLLLRLREQGVTAILITHKLNEIARVADAITTLRDGATVDWIDCRTEAISEERIIRSMVGRDLSDRYPPRTPRTGPTLFEVRGWCASHPNHPERDFIRDVDLQVKAGEIVGIAGLMGSGRTELAMSIFGRAWGARVRGQAFLDGEPADLSTIDRAVRQGIAYVTEDRKGAGLVLHQDVRRNMTLANLAGVARAGVVDAARERRTALDFRSRLNIRCAGVDQPVVNLSGGNQQKVVLA